MVFVGTSMSKTFCFQLKPLFKYTFMVKKIYLTHPLHTHTPSKLTKKNHMMSFLIAGKGSNQWWEIQRIWQMSAIITDLALTIFTVQVGKIGKEVSAYIEHLLCTRDYISGDVGLIFAQHWVNYLRDPLLSFSYIQHTKTWNQWCKNSPS